MPSTNLLGPGNKCKVENLIFNSMFIKKVEWGVHIEIHKFKELIENSWILLLVCRFSKVAIKINAKFLNISNKL